MRTIEVAMETPYGGELHRVEVEGHSWGFHPGEQALLIKDDQDFPVAAFHRDHWVYVKFAN